MEVDRRTAALRLGLGLTSALGGLATGCGNGSSRQAGSRDDASADLGLVRATLREEQTLLDLCTRVGRRYDALARLLAEPARFHRSHAELLARALPGLERPSRTAEWRPTDPRAAVAAVVTAEREAATAHRRRAMAARSGPLARVLGAMAAAAAQQGELLARDPVARRGAR